jgi:hypothetical protein
MSSLPYDGVVLSYLATEDQPPKITAVVPNTWGQGSTTIEIIGTDFTGTTTVSFGENITVSNVVVNSTMRITADINISASAAVGLRNVSVTNAQGLDTLINGFTVNNNATYLTFPASTFNLTGSMVNTSEQILPPLNNWKVTINNTIQWANPNFNPPPRVALSFYSSSPYGIYSCVQLVEYNDGKLDILWATNYSGGGHKLATIHWNICNPVTISLISDTLTVTSPAETFSTPWTGFQLAFLFGGSTQANECYGGQVYAQVEGIP